LKIPATTLKIQALFKVIQTDSNRFKPKIFHVRRRWSKGRPHPVDRSRAIATDFKRILLPELLRLDTKQI
jgi:hypothetical protein